MEVESISEVLVSSRASVVFFVIEDEFSFSIELLEEMFSGTGLVNGSGILESVEEDSEVGETAVSDSSGSIATGGNFSEIGGSSIPSVGVERGDALIASVELGMGTVSSSRGKEMVGGSTF
jgi:hypothetical protein